MQRCFNEAVTSGCVGKLLFLGENKPLNIQTRNMNWPSLKHCKYVCVSCNKIGHLFLECTEQSIRQSNNVSLCVFVSYPNLLVIPKQRP